MDARDQATVRIALVDVWKSFAGTTALHGVSLAVASGEIHGLAGGNGSGKSTLIKILAGIERADAGALRIAGEVHDLSAFDPRKARRNGLHFVHQENTTFRDLTVAENLAIGRGFETHGRLLLSRPAQIRHATSILERFQISAGPSQPLGDLSPAQQTMVAIARVLQDQDELGDGLLVLDEPTAALPPREVDRLIAALRGYASHGQSIVLVTHRLDELVAACDRISVLRDGKNVASAVDGGLSHDELVQLIVGEDAALPLHQLSRFTKPRPAMEFRGVVGGAVRGVSFTVNKGEIVGLAGLIGSGASTLLRCAAGVQPLESGEIWRSAKEAAADDTDGALKAGRVAYVPPDRMHLSLLPDETVRDNLLIPSLSGLARSGVISRERERRAAHESMHQYRVRAASIEMPIAHLSGGNQQKVVLARWLRLGPDILLLDEPTQGVDVGARADIWALINAQVAAGMSVVVASSDIEELASVCHRVLVVDRGLVRADVHGDEVTAPRILELIHSEAKEA